MLCRVLADATGPFLYLSFYLLCSNTAWTAQQGPGTRDQGAAARRGDADGSRVRCIGYIEHTVVVHLSGVIRV